VAVAATVASAELAPVDLRLRQALEEAAQALVLRNKPSAEDGLPIGYLLPNMRFRVLEGPAEVDGRSWVRVAVQGGLVGWTEMTSSEMA
jgi:hypothetical protein